MQFRSSILIALFALAHCAIAFAEERATATGKVVDVSGKSLDHATVMVYSAGAKKGYSLFCLTCYRDCGKRTMTDAEGHFAITGLSPDLLLTLLVVKDGYSPSTSTA